MSIQLAVSALNENKSVHIIYSGGSFPGKLREVVPKEIYEKSFVGHCKLRDDEREFVLDKTVFIPASEKDNYQKAALPISIGDWQDLYFLIAPYLKEDHLLNYTHQHLKLSQKGKTLIDLKYIEKDKGGFERERPYIVTSIGEKVKTYKEFNTAANVVFNDFNFAYKGEKSLNYELSYLSEMEKNWKPRAKAKLELICELINENNVNHLKTEHWAYEVKYAHREALGLSYEERQKNKKKYYTWVQNSILAFKKGDLFESKCGNYFIQVNFGVPMGWDMERDEMYKGVVTFDQFLKTNKEGIKRKSSYSCEQPDFLKILITGAITLSPLTR